jgi:hypothetical protein
MEIRAPTINAKKHQWRAPGPPRGPASIHVHKCAVTYMDNLDKSNSAHESRSPCA